MLRACERAMAADLTLPASFYRRDDVVQVSRELLGKVLCTRANGAVTKAVITETEAYAGVGDKASHAHGGRRTRRTEPMYAAGGIAYVYLCYGIHHLFNVVSAGAGTPHAILVRAARPLEGEALMRKRRGKAASERTLMAGPGTVSQALGITTKLTGASLQGSRIWIEDHGVGADAARIEIRPRVGVDYAAEDAARPYRFILKEVSNEE